MKLSTNLLLQIFGTIGQGLNQASPLLSGNSKFWVSIGLGLIQLATGVVAHYSTPPDKQK